MLRGLWSACLPDDRILFKLPELHVAQAVDGIASISFGEVHVWDTIISCYFAPAKQLLGY